MPSKDEHLQAVHDHSEFVRHRLDPDEKVDRPWMITAMFYIALHLVEAYFATKGIDHGNHGKRNSAIANDPLLAPIWSDYRYLYDRSRDARYNLIAFSKPDVLAMQAGQLSRIEAHVLGHLPP